MTGIIEQTSQTHETPSGENPFFTVPTLEAAKKISEVTGIPLEEGFAYNENPDNRIYATSTHAGNSQVRQEEIPYLDETMVEAFIEATPDRMLIYRIAPDGPAVAVIPDTAEDNLKDKILKIEKFATDHTGKTDQYSHIVLNGDPPGVFHHVHNGHHVYNTTGPLIDGIGYISEYTEKLLSAKPHEDALYLYWMGGQQTRIQTYSLGLEQGSAYYFLAAQPLPLR